MDIAFTLNSFGTFLTGNKKSNVHGAAMLSQANSLPQMAMQLIGASFNYSYFASDDLRHAANSLDGTI